MIINYISDFFSRFHLILIILHNILQHNQLLNLDITAIDNLLKITALFTYEIFPYCENLQIVSSNSLHVLTSISLVYMENNRQSILSVFY
jgi:hypothetical protein